MFMGVILFLAFEARLGATAKTHQAQEVMLVWLKLLLSRLLANSSKSCIKAEPCTKEHLSLHRASARQYCKSGG